MVRHPTADDIPQMARVHVRSWLDAYSGLLPHETIAGMTEDRRRLMWQRVIERDPTTAWVAEDAVGIVGLASIGPAQEPDGWGQLYNIYVVGRAWGSGAGTALWDAAQQGLTDKGFAKRQLYVLDTDERARRFYERKGWIHDGTVIMDDTFGEPIREVRYVPGSASVSDSGPHL